MHYKNVHYNGHRDQRGYAFHKEAALRTDVSIVYADAHKYT